MVLTIEEVRLLRIALETFISDHVIGDGEMAKELRELLDRLELV